ncbi:fkbM_fam, methyltransferase, FkbM family [Burkholderiaceae bacterium]
MKNLVYNLYRMLFARKIFYKFNRLLYGMSLRGLGILNYETDKMSGEEYFIENYVSKINNGVVIDVGANVGTYAKLIRKQQPSIEIFAFEPHPATYQKLVNNVALDRVKTYNAAVGAVQGILKLYDYENDDGSEHASLYKEVIESIHQGKSVEHEVKIISLDEFSSENKITRVGLLKIDTEGHELEVLKGFEAHLKAGQVAMIHFEFNEMNIVSRVCFKDFWSMLPNYNLFRMLPDGLVPIEKYNPLLCEIYAYQNVVAILKPKFN